jgi:hypothetical protein
MVFNYTEDHIEESRIAVIYAKQGKMTDEQTVKYLIEAWDLDISTAIYLVNEYHTSYV